MVDGGAGEINAGLWDIKSSEAGGRDWWWRTRGMWTLHAGLGATGGDIERFSRAVRRALRHYLELGNLSHVLDIVGR